MPIAFVLVGLVIVLLVGLLAVGRLGELPEAAPDATPLNLPVAAALGPQDVTDVRFAVGLRGYRMDEVDTVLERVSSDLAERDGHIEFLQHRFASIGIDPYASAAATGAILPPTHAEPEPEPPEEGRHPPGE